jgi:hypothetical protein
VNLKDVDTEFLKSIAKSLKVNHSEIIALNRYPEKVVVVVQTTKELFKKELPISEVV